MFSSLFPDQKRLSLSENAELDDPKLRHECTKQKSADFDRTNITRLI